MRNFPETSSSCHNTERFHTEVCFDRKHLKDKNPSHKFEWIWSNVEKDQRNPLDIGFSRSVKLHPEDTSSARADSLRRLIATTVGLLTLSLWRWQKTPFLLFFLNHNMLCLQQVAGDSPHCTSVKGFNWQISLLPLDFSFIFPSCSHNLGL